VTGAPVLKRSPFRSVKTYVLPSREIFGKLAASSGVTRKPPGSDLSLIRMRLAQTVETNGISPARKPIAASIESIVAAGWATRNMPPVLLCAGDSGAKANARANRRKTVTLLNISVIVPPRGLEIKGKEKGAEWRPFSDVR
jgi:hypothetical protein